MIEYRQFNIEYKSDEESRKVEGYGSVFNSESEYLGFYETIAPTAITQDTINRSDVFATFNHDPEKVLARSKNGAGTLHLSVDERGLHYEFDAPNTQLGNDLLEHLKRGDIDSSSFAFSIDASDTEAQKWERRDGKTYRTIYKIHQLYDVAAVWQPAYSEANCNKRNMPSDYETELRALEDEEKDVKDEEETINDTNTDNNTNDGNNDSDNTVQESEVEQTNIEEKNNKNSIVKQTMEKRFSLVNAINDIANNRTIDEAAKGVNQVGEAEMRTAGLAFGGQIQLPVSELRANVTVTAEGDDVVATDLYDIIAPLRANNVLLKAGAKFLTGLVGDVQIPIMSKTSVGWAAETGAAGDGAGTFSSVTLSPKRLTAYVNISKQLLTQHSVDVENMIRQDILNAISDKLEATVLGTAAGSTTQPAGLFYKDASDDTKSIIAAANSVASVSTMQKIAEAEAILEGADVIGEMKYVLSPSLKATLRTSAKGSNVSESLYVNGEIDGTGSVVTSNVGSTKGILGVWNNLVVGQWGGLDITVDPYTQAKNGMVVLVVNAFFDAQVIRPEAFVKITSGSTKV